MKKTRNTLTSSILVLLVSLVSTQLQGQSTWAAAGFVVDDPSGPPPPGYTISGACATVNNASGYNGISRLYNATDVDLRTASSGFSYTFDLNFGTSTTEGDGFSFVIMANMAYGANGGRLGYTDMSADYIAFEWDTYVNTATEGDEAGVPSQHMGISAYNSGATELANEISMGAEIRNTGAHRASISWVPDGVGGGTFTQTIVNGTTKTLTATLTAAQLNAYGFAGAANFTLTAASNTVSPEIQSACIVSTLPVALLSFTATPAIDGIELSWSTVEENNNKEFTLSRSIDGQHWEIIALVSGSGNSNSIREYSFLDNTAIKGALHYYKLTQTDYDGKSESFPSISVNAPDQTITVFPNPGNGKFEIHLKNAVLIESQEYKIYTVQGQEVFPSSIHTTVNSILIDAENLSNGIYYLNFQTNEKTYNELLIITF